MPSQVNCAVLLDLSMQTFPVSCLVNCPKRGRVKKIWRTKIAKELQLMSGAQNGLGFISNKWRTSRLLAWGLELIPRLASLMLPCSRVSYRVLGSLGGPFTNMDMARSAKLSRLAWSHVQVQCLAMQGALQTEACQAADTARVTRVQSSMIIPTTSIPTINMATTTTTTTITTMFLLPSSQ